MHEGAAEQKNTEPLSRDAMHITECPRNPSRGIGSNHKVAARDRTLLGVSSIRTFMRTVSETDLTEFQNLTVQRGWVKTETLPFLHVSEPYRHELAGERVYAQQVIYAQTGIQWPISVLHTRQNCRTCTDNELYKCYYSHEKTVQ